MRRRVWLAVGLFAVVGIALLALGAIPSLLASGDPYYLTAEEVSPDDVVAATNASSPQRAAGTATTSPETNTTDTQAANATARAVNVTGLSERRFPYATAALASGRSEDYRKGPFGLKEWFTHSPFDELSALRGRAPAAVDGDGGVFAVDNGTFYRLAVRQPA